VSRLGLSMVRNIVTSLVMEQMFNTSSKKLEKRLKALWEQSTKVSAQSQVLASKLSKMNTDEAMLAGLIHSIGILPILLEADADGSLENEDRNLEQIVDNLYPRVGAAILRKWEFPESLIEVAAEHRNLNRNSGPEGPDLVDVVQVAYLQSLFDTEKAPDPTTLNKVIAFEKVGADTGLSVYEIDEESEEYLEALALFNMKP
ncbi:MAG TPA: HDOD domain-containing protein, partial [Methylophaga aminisulfidivorans]|nr:HDOD domain-containing protein [Methylophaga aminisulfidivorans]